VKKLTVPRLLIGSAFESADILYATGFSAPDPVLLLDDHGRRTLVVSPLEYGRARRLARGCAVLTPADLPLAKPDRRRLSGWALGALRRAGIRRVQVAPTFPVGIVRRLEKSGIRVAVAEGQPYPRREVKSTVEVRHIRIAQRAAVAAMRTAIRLIRRARIAPDRRLVLDGRHLTAERVRHAIDLVLFRHDCLARETIVAGGRLSADPHERGAGPLRAGEPIVLDIFPQHRRTGYWGDLSRTVCRGPAPERLKTMYAAVRAAQAQAIRQIRAGASATVIHQSVEQSFRARGFATELRGGRICGFIHSTGHGVGLDIHEAPALRAGGQRLKRGHVVTFEPGLYYPDIGGVRIEDVVQVTARGCRCLAPLEKKLEV